MIKNFNNHHNETIKKIYQKKINSIIELLMFKFYDEKIVLTAKCHPKLACQLSAIVASIIYYIISRPQNIGFLKFSHVYPQFFLPHKLSNTESSDTEKSDISDENNNSENCISNEAGLTESLNAFKAISHFNINESNTNNQIHLMERNNMRKTISILVMNAMTNSVISSLVTFEFALIKSVVLLQVFDKNLTDQYKNNNLETLSDSINHMIQDQETYQFKLGNLPTVSLYREISTKVSI